MDCIVHVTVWSKFYFRFQYRPSIFKMWGRSKATDKRVPYLIITWLRAPLVLFLARDSWLFSFGFPTLLLSSTNRVGPHPGRNSRDVHFCLSRKQLLNMQAPVIISHLS